MSGAWTPGPWPIEKTGDGKRILVGVGLIDGPRGYDVAEVYSDDCDWDEAEANAHLIAAAPELADATARLIAAFDELRSVTNAERIVTGRSDSQLRDDSNKAIADLRAALARARGEAK